MTKVFSMPTNGIGGSITAPAAVSHDFGLPQSVRRAIRRPARLIRKHVLPRVLPPAKETTRPAAEIRVVGLLSSASGVGESARLCVRSLQGAGRPVVASDVAAIFDSNDGITFEQAERGAARASQTCIYHLNPPMLLPGIIGSGLSSYYRSFNIGYWAWELDTLPREWIRALDYVHAVFVPSRFCQSLIQRYTGKPVLLVPHPVPPLAIERKKPTASTPFRVLTIFNLGSSFGRKNPLDVIAAFRMAFGESEQVELVLKTSQGRKYCEDMTRLRQAIDSAPNIILIDEVWPRSRLAELLAQVNAYVSLHRSEGFGLPIAEAILAEIPVVVTNWSGNIDFCPPHLAYAVDYKLVPAIDPHPYYANAGPGQWASPSVEHAADLLTVIKQDEAAAMQRAQALKQYLIEHLDRNTYDRALASLRPAA
jgi:glycosyltransferase involved in cell wall biosynthesis